MRDIDILTTGETMVLVSAGAVGRPSKCANWSMSCGGAESNVAVAAARLGASVAWFGLVGNDAAGDVIVECLSAENMLVQVSRKDRPTGLMIRHHRRAGETSVDYHRAGSAASLLDTGDVPEELIRRAKIVHVSGITPALSDSAAAATHRVVDLARRNGATVSFDVNYRSKLWGRIEAGSALRPLAAKADVIFAGDDEARMLTATDEADPVKLAGLLLALGPTDAVLKRGERGALAIIDGTVLERGPVPTTTIDTVGAGDAFVGAYLAEQARGATPVERLALAARVGAYAVSVPGDCENLPTRADLSKHLQPGEVRR